MKLNVVTLFSLFATFGTIKGWNLGKVYSRSRAMHSSLSVSPTGSLLREEDPFAKMVSSKQVSPCYEIAENEKKFQVAVMLPGVKLDELSVAVDEDEHVLSITGHRTSVKGSVRMTTNFAQSFSFDRTVEMDKFRARLDDGVLIVTAPKVLNRIERTPREIPVTMEETSSNQVDETFGTRNALHEQIYKISRDIWSELGAGALGLGNGSKGPTTILQYKDPLVA